ncbi:C6 zinc finger domain containing protein [Pyrenophora tritici-repentis]|nr:C6 zinc finger domain containing protein [Pyrenophora tritici-repentis]KAG9389358.1 C6 zinc finger domain containing protein [Pyrenophora tritici-repentis]KAI1548665.1 C6 zinc finger domain containing protein [Pyrenophora tritici-repentis]KAI1552794.1 C6 zinc finger domain containing protein [Pyrenophora tritici-repentis]KAI1558002.1 C6 zinc finger domain containing protein [Pyrenophora tritici-repentis]
MNPEHRPNGSIPNGYNHAISPSHANGQPYHAQAPPPVQQYGQPVTPYAQTPYMTDYGAAQQIRRKQVRATQACNHCRSRKQKCDEARPCQFCRENNFDCQYKDVPPPKQDRSMMQLQDSVNNISEVLSQFVDQFNNWKQGVESRLPPTRNHEMISNHASPEAAFSAQRDQNTSRWPTMPGRGQMGRANSQLKMESPVVPHSNVMSPMSAIKQESQYPPPQTPATPADSVRTEPSHPEPATKDPKEKDGLQGDHTTPAHKLLEEWAQMNIFYNGIPYLKRLLDNGQKVSDYPMQLEQDRGLLRVWGVGEGQDLNDGAQGPGSPESSNDSEATSPAPGKDGLWGYPNLDHCSPSEPSSTPREHPPQFHQSGLGPDGRPDFRRHVMFDLLKSYMESMHIFHPFMNEGKLKRMFREFSDQYSPEARTANVRSPATNGVHQLNPGIKRKRSASGLDGLPSPRVDIERSLRNAIVLLVMALGKVASYTDPLPAPQNDRSPYVHSEWGYIRNSPNPNGSFASEGAEDSRPRNIDILPGMAYYAYATDILGNQQGGNTTAHAQAMLLAGLYLSQYARVLESWSWINNACRIALVLIKADYTKLLRTNSDRRHTWSRKERYRLNLVMCVYWTALQLESDILAEMSTLPPSGISAHQSAIMYPEGVNETWPQDPDNFMQQEDAGAGPRNDLMMKLYSTQTFLRVILNVAHNALYGPSGRMSFDPTSVKEVAYHAETHVGVLENWRRLLSPELAWDDHEPPSTDLNIARVRAKYYGGLYMMLRPYLKLASHVLEFPPPPPGTTGASQHNSPSAYAHSATNRNVQMVELNEDQKKIIGVACKCIHSAIQSTIAFDRVGEEPGSTYNYFTPTRKKRLVVTNIFGTLHAQFGNMLVLASVYKSKLYPLLPADTWLTKATLSALFKRTISVISDVAPNSPILRMDLEILRNVQQQQGLE